ncbi:SUR7/PalI family-domain-containing protein [Dactylonectria macrodidyma]|uniref:SUR7/PalI family-domain-containing protein n=1 Tax=Dactylonectria macrodidyma TaxID=307937 RepID=A0A9P9FUL6_9HYPO|nr:SUR7/PalI family-domain-containing protein [Dactylonectria macrodidyma]
MAKNAPLGLAGLVLTAASIVLLFFIILPGVTNTAPLRLTYFLRADTDGITGARDTTQWTFFYFCGLNNKDCGRARPAPAFGRAWDSNADNVPSQLIGSHGGDTTSTKFFYLWRFAWVLILITLFFEILAFFSGFLACCGRLGAAISGLISAVALFFSSVAMSLMTATFVLARNAFRSDNRDANIGSYAFGFAWASWAALFLATILFCIGLRGDKRSPSGGHSWGRRRRSVRSHTYDGRRVKDDYS